MKKYFKYIAIAVLAIGMIWSKMKMDEHNKDTVQAIQQLDDE